MDSDFNWFSMPVLGENYKFIKNFSNTFVLEIGWHARVSPPDHPVSQYEFDVLIGADGKRNTLLGNNFRRNKVVVLFVRVNFFKNKNKIRNSCC